MIRCTANLSVGVEMVNGSGRFIVTSIVARGNSCEIVSHVYAPDTVARESF